LADILVGFNDTLPYVGSLIPQRKERLGVKLKRQQLPQHHRSAITPLPIYFGLCHYQYA